MLKQEAATIAATLDLLMPLDATDGELAIWVEWWRPSYETSLRLSSDQVAFLKSGGWWPPASASQMGIAPEIVMRTLRPGLYGSDFF